jgi:TPR repeat protein
MKYIQKSLNDLLGLAVVFLCILIGACGLRLTFANGSSEAAVKKAVPVAVRTKANPEVAKLVHELEELCRLDPGSPCAILGLVYETGESGSKDTQLARRLLQRGCASLSPLACGHLARMYDEGIGGEVDKAMAEFHFKQACGLGDADACNVIGRQLINRNGPEGDLFVGFSMLSAACEMGKEKACSDVVKLQSEPAVRSYLEGRAKFISKIREESRT